MKIYLDNCCFNRPFDSQDQISVELEVFLTNLKKNTFDYTEWRRDNVWMGMTTDEILENAAKNTAGYMPSAETQSI
jgi:hypothetical protein